MPALDDRGRVQRFILRARKVTEHSLVRERVPLLNKLLTGQFDLRVQQNLKTGEASHTLVLELPPEELFESFAARLRPFTIPKEPVYWVPVLNSLERLLTRETRTELVDIQSLREEWKKVVEGTGAAQAYYVMTDSGHVTDFKLANEWLNSDALHTQVAQTAVARELGLNERYYAAACVFSRLGYWVEYTLSFIAYLHGAGLVELDASAFTEPVVADGMIERPTKAYCVPLGGAPMPTDMSELDLTKWKPVHEDPEIMALIERRRDAQPESEAEAG
ncbi:hypothetical protein MAHJHV64_10860 [Mycobacterium avium subsp. hominissuis]|uniref:hypothetical protein n=1 Tax=Mycobacterium avium TaxID=1764 RepID=UPI001F47D819|nr:hypothetical protein [Mycobacterium avium]